MGKDFGPHSDVGFSSALDLAAQLRGKEISSAELAECLIERIQAIDDGPIDVNPKEGAQGLQSVLAFNAQHDDQECNTQGPLAGLPILIKDNIEALGLPATAGSLALAGRTVVQDAPLVRALRQCGARILGSTNLSEWANIRSQNSTSGWSAIGGLTANPWNYARSAGGSSSGSGAAVAAGLIPFAIGTETDGSIVCPASLNGCVGIKPTVGIVSTQGVVPVSASQDSPGPLARSVSDAALLLDALTGLTTLDACTANAPLRIAVVRQWVTEDDATTAVLDQAISALSRAGFVITQVDVADADNSVDDDEGIVLLHELVEDLGAYLKNRAGTGVSSLQDVIAFNQEHHDIELEHFGQDLFELAQASGGRNSTYRAARSRNLEWALTKVLGPALHGVDVAIGATYSPAWISNLGGGDDYSSASPITTAPAIAGWPIGCLPMGFVDGMPVGLGVVARAHDEITLVRAMAQIERSLGLGILRPTFIR